MRSSGHSSPSRPVGPERAERVRRTVFSYTSDTSFLLGLLAMAVLSGNLLVAVGLTALDLPDPCPGCGNHGLGVLLQSMGQFMSFTLLGSFVYAGRTMLRQRRLRPLERGAFPAADEAIFELVRRADLKEQPKILIGSHLRDRMLTGDLRPIMLPSRPNPRLGPQLFIALGPEALHAFEAGEASRRAAEAKLCHEVAHLRNRDVRKYSVAMGLRGSFLFVGGIAILTVAFDATNGFSSTGQAVNTALRIAGMGLIIELLLRAFLRAREHYADLRAAEDYDADALVSALGVGAPPSDRKRQSSILSRHPLPLRRRELVERPLEMLEFPVSFVLVMGTLAGFSAITLQDVFFRIMTSTGAKQLSPVVVGFLVGIPLTAFLALGIWRHEAYRLLGGTRPRVVLLGLALACGLALGPYLSPYNSLDPNINVHVVAATLTLVLPLSVLLCAWLAALTRAWPPSEPERGLSPGFDRDRWLAAGVLVGGWAAALAWYWWVGVHGTWLLCHGAAGPVPAGCDVGLATLVARGTTNILSHMVPVTAAALAIVALPLARLARRRAAPRQGYD